MASRFSVEAVFKAVDKVTAPVTRMQKKVGKFTQGMTRGLQQVSGAMSGLAGASRRALGTVAVGLAATGAALANVISTGAEFEQTLTNAAAKFGPGITKGTAAFEELEKAARKTGATTEFTASQSAEALNFLAMAGFNAEQAVAALPGVVDLATAAQVDLATATDIATDSLGAFGLLTDDATQQATNLARVNDVLAKTTTTANTNMEQLFEAIQEGGPVATTAGASLETFAAAAGIMANAGIKASKAGTTMKNIFVRLTQSGGESEKVLRRLGVATRDSENNMRDLPDILEDIDKATRGMGKAQRLATIESIFGKIPLAGVNVLLEQGADKFKAYRKQLENSTGASKEMAATMRDTLQGRMKTLMSTIEGVKLSMFEMVSGPFSKLVEKTTEWFRANEKIIKSGFGAVVKFVANNFKLIVKVLAVAVGFVGGISALAGAISIATAAVWAFNAALALNPIFLVIGAVAALIAAFATLLIFWDDIVGAFKNLDGWVKVVAIGIGMLISGPLTLLMLAAGWISDSYGGLVPMFSAMWDGIVAIFEIGAHYLKKLPGIILAPWVMLGEYIAKLFGTDLESVLNKFLKFVEPVITKVKGWIDDLKGILEFLPGAIKDNLVDKLEGIASVGIDTGDDVISPQERVAKSIEEKREKSTAEIVLRSAEGTSAEVAGGSLGPGVQLQNSGAF